MEEQCVERYGQDQLICFIFDNASCHNDARDNNCRYESHRTKMLPPWSPFLNPIEECFAKCKAGSKRFLSERQVELAEPRPRGEQGAFRRNLLLEGIQAGMATITSNVVGWTRMQHRFWSFAGVVKQFIELSPNIMR